MNTDAIAVIFARLVEEGKMLRETVPPELLQKVEEILGEE